MVRDDLAESLRLDSSTPLLDSEDRGLVVTAILDALIQRVPSAWPGAVTPATVEDWLRAVKEGRA